jgi:hypothetical protein
MVVIFVEKRGKIFVGKADIYYLLIDHAMCFLVIISVFKYGGLGKKQLYSAIDVQSDLPTVSAIKFPLRD